MADRVWQESKYDCGQERCMGVSNKHGVERGRTDGETNEFTRGKALVWVSSVYRQIKGCVIDSAEGGEGRDRW
jgi:hypothetical protein